MAEIIKLNQEYTLDGKKYTEIELDFESLTGKKLLIAESEFKKRNKGVITAARNFIVVSDSEETTADTENVGETNQEEILGTE